MQTRPDSTVVSVLTRDPDRPIEQFTVVDVGASGGIADYWKSFGSSLHAVGFDPLVSNMKKMAATEKRPTVTYEAAFVGCKDFDRLFPPEERQIRVDPYPRVSSVLAQELLRVDFVADHFNEGDEMIGQSGTSRSTTTSVRTASSIFSRWTPTAAIYRFFSVGSGCSGPAPFSA